MSGVGAQEGFNDDRLGFLVDVGDEIVDLLGRDANRVNVKSSAVDDGASGACSLDGHIEHGVEIC